MEPQETSKMKVQCKTCNNVWISDLPEYTQVTECPYCESNSEIEVLQTLIDLRIFYDFEFKHPATGQGEFLGVAADIVSESDDAQVINMEGFPASQADLKYVQSKTIEYYQENQEFLQTESEIEEFGELLQSELPQIIQRCKQVDIYKRESENYLCFDVHLVTKDDWGYYKYDFMIPLK